MWAVEKAVSATKEIRFKFNGNSFLSAVLKNEILIRCEKEEMVELLQ